MSITAMATIILIGGTVAHGEDQDAAERKVTVCMEGIGLPKVAQAGFMARTIASEVFAGIGVTIDWRRGLRNCPAQGIQISLVPKAPSSLPPHALAYALPYEGTHIRLFIDRIGSNQNSSSVNNSRVAIVLGHVLVHEITHILQGITRHSESGVMKARWNQRDFSAMVETPLTFESVDIQLIYIGLSARSARFSEQGSKAGLELAQAWLPRELAH